jgi:putative PIN family toxin of toxin-antitoxin system
VKAVLDTNVLVAAFVSDGLCRRLLLRARDRTFTLTISPFIRNEFARVLKRKVAADAEEIREALELVDEISTSLDATAEETGVSGICRDPDDDGVLACAVAAGADYLVSGDNDLLVLDNCRGVKIIAPRAFELLFKD